MAKEKRSVASLVEYRRKRRFDRTPEPAPSAERKPGGRLFVIQRHAARRLHYDLRLELEGVLKSWAVPKGPCLDPGEKRLAVEVEDHPVEYGSFEGVIPQGEYGGGTVLLWDRGSWVPDADPREGYRKGHLSFTLEGEKLQGHWSLVRMRGRPGEEGRSWLLIKTQDSEARGLETGDILRERPESVSRKRRGPPKVWHAGRSRGPALRRGRSERLAAEKAPRRAGVRSLPGAKPGPLPERLEPQLATLVDRPPAGPDWLHELKLDGYRILARIEKGRVTLLTRRWNDWTSDFPGLAGVLAALPVTDALLDGEVVALDEAGASHFQLLQNAIGAGREGALVYYAFDLLHLDGLDLRGCPLLERKRALRELLASAPPRDNLRFTDHLEGSGPEFFREACARALEGVVSKRRDAPYRGGRGASWLKIKCLREQEFLIGGYTDPKGGRKGFGSLLLGYRRDGKLVYAGHVGTGFTEGVLEELYGRLTRLARKGSPFDEPPPSRHAARARWVEPVLVAQVAFTGWTQDAVLRHPSFKGLREDKPPSEIGIERVEPLEKAIAKPEAKPGSPAARSSLASLTNADRVLYPGQGITKRQLAEYYELVLDRLLPHLSRRPLGLLRCPSGHRRDCFFQKHIDLEAPKGFKGVDIEEKGEVETYFYVEDWEGVLSAVQLGALELHPWLSRVDQVENPDIMVLDLDPAPDVPFADVAATARALRERLRGLGLVPFLKTTGGKGLHVVVPLVPETPFDVVKAFAKELCEELARGSPARYTTNPAKAKRPGKIFLDYLRNGRGALAIAPYSTRAREGAPVAAPIAWEELEDEPIRFDIRTLPKRLKARRKDPWRDFFKSARTLRAAS